MHKTNIAFELGTSSIRFGKGVTREIGMDLHDLGVSHVMVLTDPVLRNSHIVNTVLESLDNNKVSYVLYDQVRVEPTNHSFQHAIDFALNHDKACEANRKKKIQGFVAVGGGSTIDTAKAVNLFTTYPADLLTYVNPPIGKGMPVPGPCKPLIAIPTTAGTGSESTGVTIFDYEEMGAKTGIAHRNLKPTLGVIDPENTKHLPPAITAATGFDVLCHAIESYTALPFDQRPLPSRPIMRPAYQGSNPVSDIWALQAIRMAAKYMPRAYKNQESDEEARAQMMLAASFAAIGFGNAGVHLCHGMSYPVSGLCRDFIPEGYPTTPTTKPFIPHGMSVVLNAPAVFRFTADACPERHLLAAEAMGADISNVNIKDAGEVLSNEIIKMMRLLNIPNGLRAVGYTEKDIPQLVEGTLPQKRVTKLAPKLTEAPELTHLFGDSMVLW